MASLCLGGCDSISGTDAFKEGKAKRAVTELLIDPSSAEFRNVSVRENAVCGELNAKNKMGAFVGFSRFVVDTNIDRALLEEEFDYAELLSADELCGSGNSYVSSSTRLSACDRAGELRATQSLQLMFQEEWASKCGPVQARKVFRPSLGRPADDIEIDALNMDLDSEDVMNSGEQHSVDAPGDENITANMELETEQDLNLAGD